MGVARDIDERDEQEDLSGVGPHRLFSHYEIATDRRGGFDLRLIVKDHATKLVHYHALWHATLEDYSGGTWTCSALLGHEIKAAAGWSGTVSVSVDVTSDGEIVADVTIPAADPVDMTFRVQGVET